MDLRTILSAGLPDTFQPVSDLYCLIYSLSEYEDGGLLYSLIDAAKDRRAEEGTPRPWPMTPFSFGVNLPDLSIVVHGPDRRVPDFSAAAPPNDDYHAWFNGLSDAQRDIEMQAIYERTRCEWVAEVRRALLWQHKLYFDPRVPSNVTLGNLEGRRPVGPASEIANRYGYQDVAPEHWELSLHERDKLYNRGATSSRTSKPPKPDLS